MCTCTHTHMICSWCFVPSIFVCLIKTISQSLEFESVNVCQRLLPPLHVLQDTKQYLVWDKEGEEDTSDTVCHQLFQAADCDDEHDGDNKGAGQKSLKNGKSRKDTKKKKKKAVKKGKKVSKKKSRNVSSSSGVSSMSSSPSRSSSSSSGSTSSEESQGPKEAGYPTLIICRLIT